MLFISFVICVSVTNPPYRLSSSSRGLLASDYNYNNWTTGTTSIGFPNDRMSIGYDTKNDTIWLLGGLQTRQLTSFKNGVFSTNFIYFAETVDGGGSQYYTQLDNFLYMIEVSGTTIQRFNIETLYLDVFPTIIPIDVNDDACLASIKQSDVSYLFVVGGYNDGFLQIYNISNNSWLTSVPSMNEGRAELCCIIHDNTLYAIGGYYANIYLDTIEILSVDDLLNIQNKQWNYIDDTLNTPVSMSSVMIYGRDILIVGGYNGNSDGVIASINVIDTLTNKVRVDGYLDIPLLKTSTIIANNIGYAFCGRTSDQSDALSSWRYIDLLPTPNPTAIPTNDPTSDPTAHPTTVPTTHPTTDPTSIPTLSTDSPTVSPTNSTRNPTRSPSIDPTNMPPTSAPSNDSNPTISPSTDPTTENNPNNTNQPITYYPTSISVTPNQSLESLETNNENEFVIIISIFAVLLIICSVIVIFIIFIKMRRNQKKAPLKNETNIEIRKMEITSKYINANDDDDNDDKIEKFIDLKAQQNSNKTAIQIDDFDEKEKNEIFIDKLDQITATFGNEQTDSSNDSLSDNMTTNNTIKNNDNILNEKKYELWTSLEVYKWIISLPNADFVSYLDTNVNAFKKSLVENENIKGIHLKQIDKQDIYNWGITRFEHKMYLFERIQQLISVNDNVQHEGY